MKRSGEEIIPMTVAHVHACNKIVSASQPWKRLNESVDFKAVIHKNRTNTLAFVCRRGHEIAGFILFIPEPVFARGGYLRAIGVAPEYRGKGIGRKLLSFAEKRAAERSMHLFLCVSSFNRTALTFYRNCGYSRVGTLPGILIPGASEYIFWKRLRTTLPKTRRTKPWQPRT